MQEPSIYEPCPDCHEARAAGDLVACRRCHGCDGKGIVRDPKSFQCNGCGGSLAGDNEHAAREQYGLVETKVRGGYSSPHLTDCTTYVFSLCELCLRKLFATFKVPPSMGEYSIGADAEIGTTQTYADDVAGYEYNQWKYKEHGHIPKLKLGICNATILCVERATTRRFCSGFLTEDCFCDEHREKRIYANAWQVPFESVGFILNGNAAETLEDKRRVALAWLLASSRGEDVITHHQYASDCVRHLTGVGDGTSMLWVPTALQLKVNRPGQNDLMRLLVVPAKDHGDVQLVEFAEGLLLLGSLKGLAPSLKRPDVLAAKVLPNLPEPESDG